MTPQQIKNKIDELSFWLVHNPSHTDYPIVLKDKIELDRKYLFKND